MSRPTNPSVFATILSSFGRLLGGSKASKPVRQRAPLEIEALEARIVPTSSPTAAQIQSYKVADYQIGVNYIIAGAQAYQAYKTIDIAKAVSVALQDFNNAKTWLSLSYSWVKVQYLNGYESLATARQDTAVLSEAFNLANQDINYMYTSPGALGDLLNIDGHYIGDMPNYFAGSNMMPA
jgi:hypothetical protein